MEAIQKIGKIEAICLIVMVTVNEIIFNIPNFVIINSGSASWMTVLMHFVFILLFGLLLSKFFKVFGSKDLVDISRLFRWKCSKMDYRNFIFIFIYCGFQLYITIFFKCFRISLF